MKMKRPPEALVAWFDEILPRAAAVERRKMFGCPCAFVGGHMFAGVFEDRVFLRLGKEGDAFLALPEAEPWKPMGRPMGGFFLAPPAMVEERDEIGPWLRRAMKHAAALPPKAPKEKARQKARATAKAEAPKKKAAKAAPAGAAPQGSRPAAAKRAPTKRR